MPHELMPSTGVGVVQMDVDPVLSAARVASPGAATAARCSARAWAAAVRVCAIHAAFTSSTRCHLCARCAAARRG
eukprot:7377997-Prymnesium_polylepis.1